MSKPILCLYFDGVCHQYTSGWQGIDVIPDPPVEGMWEFLIAASKTFEIAIFSSRSEKYEGIEAMMMWFERHCPIRGSAEFSKVSDNESYVAWYDDNCELVLALNFPSSKPPAHISLDARALTFTGVWPQIEQLTAFKPWNKKDL